MPIMRNTLHLQQSMMDEEGEKIQMENTRLVINDLLPGVRMETNDIHHIQINQVAIPHLDRDQRVLPML
jgi:hypothetical protein